MGSLKALQEWCRSQCESYSNVDITNMSSSFRDGLAFCAIIHKHRPDLIDFDSLSKENVFENNHLAFEVAESELGIPALLDPEDMVSMSVPDRLSIITYVSQYYNYFTNKSHTVSTKIKSPGGPGHIKPAIKRPSAPPDGRDTQTESGADFQPKRSTLSSICSVCGKHVHLVQRILVDGKLYHRNCFRCRECSRTLLPGSYKFTEDPGSLVCTHHFTRSASTNQNGHYSNQLDKLTSTSPEDPNNRSLESKASHSDAEITPEREEEEITEIEKSSSKQPDGRSKVETEHGAPCSSSPPNPFDESEEEDQDTQQEDHKPAADVANGDGPATLVKTTAAEGRPVPAPRRAFEPTPAPRPVPRPRPPRPSESPIVNGDPDTQIPQAPVPRERLHSPARSSKANDTPKPKDPPWLALVQSETKKKPAPRPPTGIAIPPCTGSSPSQKEEESRPSSPPNPFDNDEEEEPEICPEDPPGPVVASHPWYGITQASEITSGDTRRQSPAPSESPISVRRKKRPAPKAPNSSTSALSTESLSSSSSDHSAVPQQPAAAEDHLFTKSVSEPSINAPASALSQKTKLQPHCSPNLPPPPPPTNTSSAPATPQTNRSVRPPPSPYSQTPSTPGKRTCKENPFNRKTTTTVSSSVSRPPKGPRPARPPAPGHGFPLIKRKVQSDQYIPVEDIHVEMSNLEKRLDELEQRGVDLEKSLRECSNDDEEEHLLVDWFTLIQEKHLLVRREAELVYTAKQQNLEERQADVEYELRCLLNKPEKEWTAEDKDREKQLMAELVTIIEQRNQIVNSIDLDRQREEEEDKLVAAMLKKKEFYGPAEQKKKAGKFKPMKVLKRLSTKNEGVKDNSPRKENS
ncbi:MICAL-like protein 1 isoform X2 [Sinocyclocheilus grahami]|uniref:MICAL-like protein 1 isoform X2 n=1 Tax=Sinocyclocheilus grahami TaxID=75366 RepID=UPI0007AD63DF|nr:PREDICTED: MICAL-like protein 1 isoform X2 [Sinocyclocheilus grahami]